MEFSYSVENRLIERHQALVSLAKYLQGDKYLFFAFLQDVYRFEKNLEERGNPAEAQFKVISSIFKGEEQLKQVLRSTEWQKASEYFVVPSNESALLDVYYRLEIGNLQTSGEQVANLRNSLLHAAFIEEKESKGLAIVTKRSEGEEELAIVAKRSEGTVGTCKINDVVIKFIFSSKTTRWSLDAIEWNMHDEQGKPHIIGMLIVSLGQPQPDGPSLYRELFALIGSETRAASLIAIRGIQKENIAMQNMAREILRDMDIGLEKLHDFLQQIPTSIDEEKYAQWAAKDLLLREFSPDGLSFLRSTMKALRESLPQGYDFIKKRFSDMGFEFRDAASCGYEFSNNVAQGEVASIEPTIGYYWPYEDTWEAILIGHCRISAGHVPVFLQKVQKLSQKNILSPRVGDLEIVTQMLLHIYLGEDKVSKPPLLPLYNALRRWLEIVSSKEEYALLEDMCFHAKIFRPYVQIPHVGEHPIVFAGKEHKLVPREMSGCEEGIIVGIQQAGIIVPDAKMPLFVPGIYWTATTSKK